jgi:hypothetical protein
MMNALGRLVVVRAGAVAGVLGVGTGMSAATRSNIFIARPVDWRSRQFVALAPPANVADLAVDVGVFLIQRLRRWRCRDIDGARLAVTDRRGPRFRFDSACGKCRSYDRCR